MECFTFDEFGTDAIKAIKLSPDSFIQIAMQVTFYNLRREPPAHYESAALRRFINARTECIRSTCTESVEFAEMMLHDAERKTQKREMMIKAINAHKELAGQVRDVLLIFECDRIALLSCNSRFRSIRRANFFWN